MLAGIDGGRFRLFFLILMARKGVIQSRLSCAIYVLLRSIFYLLTHLYYQSLRFFVVMEILFISLFIKSK